jgi:hypothetical protein
VLPEGQVPERKPLLSGAPKLNTLRYRLTDPLGFQNNSAQSYKKLQLPSKRKNNRKKFGRKSNNEEKGESPLYIFVKDDEENGIHTWTEKKRPIGRLTGK